MFYVGIGHYLGLLVTTSFQIREIGLESAPIKAAEKSGQHKVHSQIRHRTEKMPEFF